VKILYEDAGYLFASEAFKTYDERASAVSMSPAIWKRRLMDLPANLLHLVRDNEDLSRYTWLGIGGPAQYFAEPTSESELVSLVRIAAANGLPIRVLGGGSNLLIRESGVDGLVIFLNAGVFCLLQANKSNLIAGGGAKLSHAVAFAAGKGLGGLESLAAIPGTVGGAVQGNVSASGTEIAQVVESVKCLGLDGEVSDRKASAIRFSHRHSDLNACIVLEVTFRLETMESNRVTKRTQQTWIVRRGERPAGENRIAVPFVDPDGATAASLIEQAGLKGARRGGAEFHSSSASYLVVHNGATSDDVLGLVETVREQVLAKTGTDLQLGLKIW
jgi:UDP-N-acetylmuramate dehydrogenase